MTHQCQLWLQEIDWYASHVDTTPHGEACNVSFSTQLGSGKFTAFFSPD
jgi:hypothetical protein